MPQEEVIARAQEDKEQGKLPNTQAGGFVREEMHHIREGKHGARSPQQAIAIGLSKARRAGVKLPPPKSTRVSSKKRKQAQRDLQKGKTPAGSPSKVHSRAVLVRCAQTGRAIRSITCESLEACTCCRSDTWREGTTQSGDEGGSDQGSGRAKRATRLGRTAPVWR